MVNRLVKNLPACICVSGWFGAIPARAKVSSKNAKCFVMLVNNSQSLCSCHLTIFTFILTNPFFSVFAHRSVFIYDNN